MLRPGFSQPNRSQADVTVSSSAERPIPTPPARQERIPQAIIYMVAAGAIFSFSSAASKWLVATYPLGEVLFSRVFVSLMLFLCLRAADLRAGCPAHPAADRACAAQHVAVHLADPAADRVQHDAAGERDRDQFLGAAVRSARLVGVPEGADRRGALGRAGGRLFRRADRHQPGWRDVPDRRALCARQCAAVRHRHRGRPRHDARPSRPRP